MKITDINDYVKQVHDKFPELTESEVKRILVYGWKMILQYKSQGNDISIINNDFFFFIGEIPKNTLKLFNQYKYKLAKKIQWMFKKSHAVWDGYYYFSRSENQYQEYLKQTRRKFKIFKDVFLFKLLDECKVSDNSAPYIFRLKENKTRLMKKYYPEIRSKNAELIIQRDPMNMQDLLISNNNYKYIK